MKKIVFILFISFLISQICLGNSNVGEQQDKLGVSIIGSRFQRDSSRTDYITSTFLSPNVIPVSSTASQDFFCCVTSTVAMTHVSENEIKYGPEGGDHITTEVAGLTSPHSFSATFETDWSDLPSGIAEYLAYVEVGGGWPQVKADVMITSTVPFIMDLWPPSSDRGRSATVDVYTDNLPVTFTMDAAPFGLFITDTSTMITSSDYSTIIPGGYYEVTFTLPSTMAIGDWILYMMFTKDTFKYNINKTPFPITNPPANTGDLIISEIMQNPSAVADDKGEWFEIFNGTDSSIDINGWIIRNENYSNSHTISNGGPLVVPSQGFLVLGNNDNSGTNGGYTCDYKYTDSGFILGNGADELILETPGHTVIDIVEWDGETNWPNPDGASMVFIGEVGDDNNDYNFWTTATTRENTYTGTTGDLGSPGTIGNQQTLPVELSSFTAQFISNLPVLCWTTQSETGNAGWNVYRGDYRDAFINGDAIQINPELIEGAGTTSIPTNYTFEDQYDVIQGSEYWYILESVDYSGETHIHGSVSLIIPEEGTTPELPQITVLKGNYPNPFNPITYINFSVKENETAQLTIFNAKGQKIESISFEAGTYNYLWDASSYATGTYLYKLKSESISVTKKMILLK